jgi:phage terminase large subunit-like protein
VTTKAPLVLYPRQERILRHVLTRPFPYHTILYSDIGKSGKTMIAAAAAQWFGNYVEPGSEIPIAANKLKQADIRVFGDLERSVKLAEAQGYKQALNITGGEITFSTGSIARALPVSAGGEAGGHNSLVVWDELWACDTEAARRMYEELKRDPTLNDSLVLIVSYSPYEGEDTPLNKIHDRIFDEYGEVREGVETVPGLEDLPCYVVGGMFVYWNKGERHLPWHTDEFIEAERERMRDVEFRRIWLNTPTSSQDAFIDIKLFDRCEDELLTFIDELSPPTPLVLGVDASKNQDFTAISGRAWNPVTETLDLRYLKVWKPEHRDGQHRINLLDVRAEVFRLNEKHRIIGVYYDPHQMAAIAMDWERKGIPVIEFPQTQQREEADMAYRNMIENGRLRHPPGSYELREAIRNAVTRESSRGFRLVKDATTRKIDAAVADSMACYGVLENKARFRLPIQVAPQISIGRRLSEVYRRDVW